MIEESLSEAPSARVGHMTDELSFRGESSGKQAEMGDNIAAPAGQQVKFAVEVNGATTPTIEIIRDGIVMPQLGAAAATHEFSIESDGKRHWYRVNVRAADGSLLALTNPIYMNFAK